MSALSETYDSICHFNPTADSPEVDPAQDCGRAARWHLLAREAPSGGVEAYQACEEHLGRALQLDGVEEFHDFSSSCGLEGSYWIMDSCASEETLLANGLAWIEVLDPYGKPEHPLPGTYIRERATQQWYRFNEAGIWVESEPAPGAVR